jgi:hypothetical protein
MKKSVIYCVSLSVRDWGLARRDRWSLAIFDRRVERSVKRIRGKAEGEACEGAECGVGKVTELMYM